jgi:hypothetical protein
MEMLALCIVSGQSIHGGTPNGFGGKFSHLKYFAAARQSFERAAGG